MSVAWLACTTKLLNSFFKSRFPLKSVNLSFIIPDVKNKLTDLCGSWPLQSDLVNTFYEINTKRGTTHSDMATPRNAENEEQGGK